MLDVWKEGKQRLYIVGDIQYTFDVKRALVEPVSFVMKEAYVSEAGPSLCR